MRYHAHILYALGTLSMCITLACASDSDAGAQSLDPLPKTVPLMPMPENLDTLPPDERLMRRIENALRERDAHIRAIVSDHPDLKPQAALGIDGAELIQPRKERDRAWTELQKALGEFIDNAPRASRDPLDVGKPKRKAAQAPPLSAVNMLRIAECYQDLICTATSEPGDLGEGLRALDAIDATLLPASERPRLGYLRVFFLVEQARHATGDERVKLVASARVAQTSLQQEYPGSELTNAASALVSGIQGANDANPMTSGEKKP